MGCRLWGRTESDTTEALRMHACLGKGNDNPLQYSCLENPRHRGAWWTAIYGATQSWVEQRGVREETQATWWRKRRVQKGREQSSQ